MKSYDRYQNVTADVYDKKGTMTYLVKVPSDKKIIPLVSKIKNKKILDVGLGSGYYTRILIESNDVTGIDQNPHLCKLPVRLYKGDATELSNLIGEQKFDIVLSTWLTEYLNEEQLLKFFFESRKVLKDNGKLITTVISRYGMGFIYITMAKLVRGIDKYNYKKRYIIEKLQQVGFSNIKIIDLNSWLYIPWAYLVVAR